MQMAELGFARNHMVAPRLPLLQLIEIATALGVDRIEIRNNQGGHAMVDGMSPETVRQVTSDAGFEIMAINALQHRDCHPGQDDFVRDKLRAAVLQAA